VVCVGFKANGKVMVSLGYFLHTFFDFIDDKAYVFMHLFVYIKQLKIFYIPEKNKPIKYFCNQIFDTLYFKKHNFHTIYIYIYSKSYIYFGEGWF